MPLVGTSVGSLFTGTTFDWGFTPGDIISNSIPIVVGFAGFIVLAIALGYVPKWIEMIKTAVSPGK